MYFTPNTVRVMELQKVLRYIILMNFHGWKNPGVCLEISCFYTSNIRIPLQDYSRNCEELVSAAGQVLQSRIEQQLFGETIFPAVLGYPLSLKENE
ncbi:hypothetical protein JTB14_027574 [Gonioctena quinquepunctata]|nr:hypothetical protein JTB14_027574 [Gonioctena quinquepunctata]